MNDHPALLATVVHAYADQSAAVANHVARVLTQARAQPSTPMPLSHREWEHLYAWLDEDDT